ncbi:MAG: OmpA family protein [Bacteroidales bacterium]|nr:OmpA family protein [Bacteroidales bacterium]
MRKILIAAIAVMSICATSCVTKQKYLELESKYNKCREDEQFASNELRDCQNKNRDFDRQVNSLQGKVDQLKQDTLTLSRRLAQTESEYAKSRRDYDELAKSVAVMNKNNTAAINELTSNLDSAQLNLQKKQAELEALQEQLEQQAQELQSKQDSLNTYASSLTELQKVLDQKDAEVRALKDKVSNALKNFEGSGLKVEQRNGKVYVSMDEKLLFASARWEVQGEGKEALKELAKVLEADNSINVLIEGHTDNLRYNGSGQVKDNWDLSVMRATSVVKLILSYGDIDPQRISASGRGEYFPIDTDATPEARAKNRRTEIILTPKLDELFQIIDNN